MKYVAPVAELVSMEAISVIMASTTCDRDGLGEDEGGEY